MDHAATMRRAYDLITSGEVDAFGELLADDFTPDEIRTSLDAWALKPLGPGALPSIASELFCRPSSGTLVALDRQRAGVGVRGPTADDERSAFDTRPEEWLRRAAAYDAQEAVP